MSEMSTADKWVFWVAVAAALLLLGALLRNVVAEIRERRVHERRVHERRAKEIAALSRAFREEVARETRARSARAARLRSEWSDDPLKGFRDQRGVDVEPRTPNNVVGDARDRPYYYGRPQSSSSTDGGSSGKSDS